MDEEPVRFGPLHPCGRSLKLKVRTSLRGSSDLQFSLENSAEGGSGGASSQEEKLLLFLFLLDDFPSLLEENPSKNSILAPQTQTGLRRQQPEGSWTAALPSNHSAVGDGSGGWCCWWEEVWGEGSPLMAAVHRVEPKSSSSPDPQTLSLRADPSSCSREPSGLRETWRKQQKVQMLFC